MAVRRKLIRRITEELLDKYDVSKAPVPVEKIARKLGVEVRLEPAEKDLSGFLLRDVENRRVIIGVNRRHAATRRRFTIAHELGHFLLHEGERVHVDHTGQLFTVKLRAQTASQGTDLEEREANWFAAELLMPERFLARELGDSQGLDLEDDARIKAIAKSYGASVQALTFRLANLGYGSLQ